MLAAQTKEIVIPVGALSVRMSAPLAAEEVPDRLTFWWGITSAAVALARHLESSGGLSGESVLELGCGTGLAGVTAGLLGGQVTFTDYVEDALTYARKNCLLNGLNEPATGYRVCWIGRIRWTTRYSIWSSGPKLCMIISITVACCYFSNDSCLQTAVSCLRIAEGYASLVSWAG